MVNTVAIALVSQSSSCCAMGVYFDPQYMCTCHVICVYMHVICVYMHVHGNLDMFSYHS